MSKKCYEFLKVMYQLAGESTLPFTEYLNVFIEKLKMSTYDVLCVYGILLEKDYIKTARQDRIFLTGKALKKLNIDIA